MPSDRVEVPADADGILAVGGGSAIDTGKAASAQAELPLVSVPTTYSGAEWTTFYGMRTPDRRIQGGGSGARPAAIVYDVDLTLDLPPAESGGTALNALAHCAEALYVRGHNPEGDAAALSGAALIAGSLPRVLAAPHDREAREELLRGAADAGRALGLAGLALAHAMAQALGGTYGIPHGAMNALCLPPALAFNRELVPDGRRPLRRRDRRRSGRRKPRAGPPRRLRAPARLRRSRRRSARSRRRRGRPRRQSGEPAPGNARGDRGPARRRSGEAPERGSRTINVCNP